MKALALCLALTPAVAHGALAEIYPSGATLPANVLRLHVTGESAAALRLEDVRLTGAPGAEVAGAFLDLPLVSRDGGELTLLFHPGRVKSGLQANLTGGRAVQPGDVLTLEIGPERRNWRIVAAESTPIALESWRIDPPSPGTREPLVVNLERAVDALAARRIAVADVGGASLAGDSRLLPGEATWSFIPLAPWRAGPYELRIHPDLEDVAGNRMCAPFEAVALSAKTCPDGRIDFDLAPPTDTSHTDIRPRPQR